jgi:nicotinamidase-related amidase
MELGVVDFPVIPRQLALINVDLQNLFVAGFPLSAPDGLAVVERVNRLARVCRRCGIPVIHTRHVTRPDGSDAGVMGEIIPPTRHGLIAADSFPAALHQALEVEPSDVVLDKPRFGAFQNTVLESLLRKRGIDGVMITGISTNVCAETTAREANLRDFRVFFLSDGTSTADIAGVSRHDLQRISCAVLGFAFAQVLRVDEMIEKLQRASA